MTGAGCLALAVALCINLNTATLPQLESLPGVSLEQAAELLEHRRNAGGWRVLPAWLPEGALNHVKLTGETK